MKFVIITLMILMLVSVSFGIDLSFQDKTGGSEESINFIKIDEGEEFKFNVMPTEDGLDVATIKIWNKPDGSYFNNGLFTWVPSDGQAGMYRISFSAMNPLDGKIIWKSMAIVVADTHLSIRYNKLYEKLFTATDPDDNKVTITVTGLPQGATFIGSQFGPKLFSWRPTRQQIGNHQMIITATDYPEPGEEPEHDMSIIHIKVTKLDVADAMYDYNDDDQITHDDLDRFAGSWLYGTPGNFFDDGLSIAYAKMAPEEITMEQLMELAKEWLSNTCIK